MIRCAAVMTGILLALPATNAFADHQRGYERAVKRGIRFLSKEVPPCDSQLDLENSGLSGLALLAKLAREVEQTPETKALRVKSILTEDADVHFSADGIVVRGGKVRVEFK